MKPTTSYGNFTNFAPEALTLSDYIAGALGEFAADYDLAAIATQLRAALNAALPDGVALAGDELYGPYDERHQEIDYQALLADIDFWEIADRHHIGKHVAYIGNTTDAVPGGVMVVAVYLLAEDGPTGDALLEVDTTVAVAGDDARGISEATGILEEAGWEVTGEWEYDDAAIRATVTRSTGN